MEFDPNSNPACYKTQDEVHFMGDIITKVISANNSTVLCYILFCGSREYPCYPMKLFQGVPKPISNCVAPENIHTPPTEGIGNSWGVGGSQRPKNLKKCMRLNWNFQRGGGFL